MKYTLTFLAFTASTHAMSDAVYFDNQEQIKKDFVEKTVKMIPSREGKIRSPRYRVNLEEVDVNGDNKDDIQLWGFFDLGRPSQRHVYLCASNNKDCSNGSYCYAGYYPGTEIDKGMPKLKCKVQ